MLPQANLTSILPNVQFEGPPRNSCYLKGIGANGRGLIICYDRRRTALWSAGAGFSPV